MRIRLVLLAYVFFAGMITPRAQSSMIPDLCAASTDTVPAGQTVTLTGSNTKTCYAVHGTLKLSSGATLSVDTLYVYPEGTLIVGEPGAVVSNARITFRDVPPTDAEQWGTGLVALGHVTMRGQPKTPWVGSTGPIAAGATTLRLTAAPSGWAVGDRLVIPGSTQARPESGPTPFTSEVVTITAITGSTVTTSPAQYLHPAAIDAAGAQRFAPTIGNLTRSVNIGSANPSGSRGHVVFSGAATIDIESVAWTELGRTTIAPITKDAQGNDINGNRKGRYPPHCHMLKDAGQCTIKFSVVEGSPKWGLTVHQTNHGLIQDNVIYRAKGAGIMLEDGNEADDRIERNLIVATYGNPANMGEGPNTRKDTQDFAFDGTGIWARSPGSRINDNIVADAYVGFMLDTVYSQVLFPGGINPNRVPVLEMRGNEISAVRINGMQIYDIGGSCCSHLFPVGESVIADMKMWHITGQGYYFYGINHFTFLNPVIINDAAVLQNGFEGPIGIWWGDYLARQQAIVNPDFQNLRIGIYCVVKPGDTDDAFGNAPGELTVTGGKVVATTGFLRATMGAVTGGATMPPRTTTITGTKFSAVPGNPGGAWLAIRHSYELGRTANLVVKDTLTVDGIEIYWPQQAPTYVMDAGPSGSVGSPEPGLTNAQTWAKYGKATAGAVTPCLLRRPDTDGFVCNGTPIPVPPDRDGDGVPDTIDACPDVAGTTTDGCPVPPAPLGPEWSLLTYLTLPDNAQRYVWTRPDAQAQIWTISPAGAWAGAVGVAGPAGWLLTSYAVRLDGSSTLVWTLSGYSQVWTINADGSFRSAVGASAPAR